MCSCVRMCIKATNALNSDVALISLWPESASKAARVIAVVFARAEVLLLSCVRRQHVFCTEGLMHAGQRHGGTEAGAGPHLHWVIGCRFLRCAGGGRQARAKSLTWDFAMGRCGGRRGMGSGGGYRKGWMWEESGPES